MISNAQALRRALVAAVCAVLLCGISVAFAQGQGAPRRPGGQGGPGGLPESQAGKTVEQVRKNIQVLNGMPATQLNTVMDLIASSLGVRCNHCHVIDSTGWQMEKDDKQNKKTARRMIQMVKDINAKTFGGRPEVTCFTCHRGSTEPASTISLPVPALPPPPPPGQEAQAQPALPTVESLLAKYEEAIGGQAAIGKVKSRISRGVNVDGQGREMPMELVQQAPDKFASSVTFREGMTSKRGYDGKTGWSSSPRGTMEMPPEEAKEMANEYLLFPVGAMKALSTNLHVRGTEMVNGATAYELSAMMSDGVTVSYFIDSTSNLLVRKETITDTPIGQSPEQTDYSDYRVVDGVKVPFVMKSASPDPRDAVTRKLTSVEQNGKIDEKQFSIPPSKK